MNKITAIKGTVDILPGAVEIWQTIERAVREVMAIAAYEEIRTPVFEETGLFARSIGEDTDIVGKEMYTFSDMGGRSLTLRPEGTASVVRAFVEHSLDQGGLPRKLWYMGPMFRQERPQKGRQRQFHQFGVEVIGTSDPAADAEAMIVFDRIAGRLGLDERAFLVNSIGGPESRTAYRDALVAFLGSVEGHLCDDCKRRMTTNPLRVLDCKNPGCHTVVHDSGKLPGTLDYLTAADREHFERVCGYLDSRGVRYEIDPFLVRGLDYYTGTVFEMQYRGLGAQSAIMGGGRYDRLVKELGGPDLPAVGFAAGMERLILAMQAAGSAPDGSGRIDVYVVAPGDDVRGRAFGYVEELRNDGVVAEMDYAGRSMKAQMKSASRLGARWAVIVEPDDDRITARDMEASGQQELTFDGFREMLKK